MEITRVLLLCVLFLFGFMIWNAWENDYPSTPAPVVTQPQQANGQFQPVSVVKPTGPTSTATIPHVAAKTLEQNQRLVRVHTDVLDIAIDTLGGNIVRTKLLKYPQTLHSMEPYQLLSDDPSKLYVAQSGLVSTHGPDTIQGQALYKTIQTDYNLAPDQDQLTVNLQWQNKEGVTVTKQFTFRRNDYAVGVNYQIVNRSTQPWDGQFYAQLTRKKAPPPEHGMFGVNPYVGAAISTPDKPYEKISFDKMLEQNLNLPVTGGWAAFLEHYFLSAWVPLNTSQSLTYYTHVSNEGLYTLGLLSQPLTVAPGQQGTAGAKLYAGPESMDRLKAVAPNLDLTIDYGILWFISSAVFWLMKKIYDVVGNWGWSIVLVTVLIKLAFYHLSAKSYRSMAAMRSLQPKLQALKERFGDDRQKLTQATMELYKAEKVNPLGGCLPVIVQIPVFIALYWVLLESVELRQASFLWIHDLTLHDPYYILPIIMGVTMYIQQRLNPPPPDPMQAKMMQFLPIFFTFLFLNFPAGLVLYWVVNNTLSILQQWYITRSVEQEIENKKKKKLLTSRPK